MTGAGRYVCAEWASLNVGLAATATELHRIMPKLKGFLCFLLYLLIVCLASPGSCANDITSCPVPDPAADSPYMVSVNGVSLPIEKAGGFKGAYYVRFGYEVGARVEIAIKDSVSGIPSLKPSRSVKNIDIGNSVAGMNVGFTVTKPGAVVMMIGKWHDQAWPLILFAEKNLSKRVFPKTYRVLHVKDYVKGDGIQTARIQRLLDECSRVGNSVAYFDAGIYKTGALKIWDNTIVYMAPGSLIQASIDPNDFPVDKGFKETGSHGPVESFSRLICFDNCKNSKLIGPGVIDGMGHILRNVHGRHVHVLDVIGGSNNQVRDVILRNSAAWTFQPLGTKKLLIENVKIVADWAVGNTDGIDPDSSQDVTINNYFGFCGDDAIAIKTTNKADKGLPVKNIKVTNSLVMTRKTSYKLGTETYLDMDGVLFENCDAINSARGIGLWMRDGHTMQNVVFRNMSLDLYELKGEGWSGEPVRITNEARNGIGKIKNVLIENVRLSTPYGSVLEAPEQSPNENITFRNCRLEVRQREIKMSKRALFVVNYAKDLTFENTMVTWKTQAPTLWEGFLKQQNSKNIVVRGLVEKDVGNR